MYVTSSSSTSLSESHRIVDATDPQNQRYIAIFPNLLSAGIFNIPLQLPDNLLFLYAYNALTTAGRARRYMNPQVAVISTVYIAFVLFFPFLAPVTFIPLILNENTEDYNNQVGLPLIQGYVFGYLAWNVFFTLIFIRILYRYYFDKRAFYPAIAYEISVKCVLHCVLSSFAVLEFYFFGIQMMRPFVSDTLSNSLFFTFYFRQDHYTHYASCADCISYSIRRHINVGIEIPPLRSFL